MLPDGDGNRLGDPVARWERGSAMPLTALAIVFLAAYAAPILRPDLPAGWRGFCAATATVIWVVFWLDFAARLALARDRRRFLRRHLFDLAVLVLPMLRPLRAIRLVTAVLMISRRTETWARGRLAVYVGTATALLVFVAGLAVLDAERAAPQANITTFDDALWWSVVTITTVGYGDHYPVTTVGRFVALALMVGGIGLIGFVTGSLATWIVERIAPAGKPAEATSDDVAALRAEVAALREVLTAREALGTSEIPSGPGAPAADADRSTPQGLGPVPNG